MDFEKTYWNNKDKMRAVAWRQYPAAGQSRAPDSHICNKATTQSHIFAAKPSNILIYLSLVVPETMGLGMPPTRRNNA